MCVHNNVYLGLGLNNVNAVARYVVVAATLFRRGAGEGGCEPGSEPVPPPPPSPRPAYWCWALIVGGYTSLCVPLFEIPPTHRGMVKATGRLPPRPPYSLPVPFPPSYSLATPQSMYLLFLSHYMDLVTD